MGNNALQAILGGAAGGLDAFAQNRRQQREDDKSERREVRQEAREDRKDSMQERLFNLQVSKMGLELETIQWERDTQIAEGTPEQIAEERKRIKEQALQVSAQELLNLQQTGALTGLQIRQANQNFDASLAQAKADADAMELADFMAISEAEVAAADSDLNDAFTANLTTEELAPFLAAKQLATANHLDKRKRFGLPPEDTAPAPIPGPLIPGAANAVSTNPGLGVFFGSGKGTAEQRAAAQKTGAPITAAVEGLAGIFDKLTRPDPVSLTAQPFTNPATGQTVTPSSIRPEFISQAEDEGLLTQKRKDPFNFLRARGVPF